MANRYWVGGTANWDQTAGSKWATSSGGAGGAAVPTSSDDVFFDTNSGSGTVTVVNQTASSLNLDFTGFAGSLAGTTQNINVYGNLNLGSTVTLTGFTRAFNVNGEGVSTSTITTNGLTPSRLAVGTNGNGNTIQLADNLTVTNIFSINGSIFRTQDFSITSNIINGGLGAGDAVYLGSSQISCYSFDVPPQSLSVIWDGGTSTITINGTDDNSYIEGNFVETLNTPGSYYNLVIAGTAGTKVTVYSSNTFNDVTINPGKIVAFESGQDQSINGNFVADGTPTNKIGIYSDTTLMTESFHQATLIKTSGDVIVSNCDIQNSNTTGGATWTAIKSTDLGNNVPFFPTSSNDGWVFGNSSAPSGIFMGAEDVSPRVAVGASSNAPLTSFGSESNKVPVSIGTSSSVPSISIGSPNSPTKPSLV